jgi:hypothetical protein
MKLSLPQADPLGVLGSTKPIVEKARSVSINREKLEEAGVRILDKFGGGLDIEELGFRTTGSEDKVIQLSFIENVLNFCFWPGKGQPKWIVKWPEGKAASGGWYGLVACFERGLAEGSSILDAGYLASLSAVDAWHFLRGVDGVEIPLFQERVDVLHEAGKVLLDKFDGQFINAVKSVDYDAIGVARLVIENFPSFRDISHLDGQEIKFFKRAQICPKDLSYVLAAHGKKIKNLDQLTAYVDYKLPQTLRMFGILEYEDTLSDKVDNLIELPHDSREEIEIRSATIWAVELLRRHLRTLSAGEIDNTLWLMSQGVQGVAKPYHRTRTIYY